MTSDLQSGTDQVAADAPAVGSAVTLLPVSVDGVWVGEVASWTSSPTGLVVTSEVSTTSDAVRVLNVQRVWVSARTERLDTLVVFEAIAQARGADTLTLTGVVAIAHESRRRAVRAATVWPVVVDVPSGGQPIRTHTVDISRSGCRIALPAGQDLPAQAAVELVVEMGRQEPIRASGDVLRVDVERGEAVVRFAELDPADGGRIERLVLGQLRQQAAETGSGE